MTTGMESYVYTLALVSQKGGAGKTTLAVHLAIEAQRNGFRTLVLDLDPQASASKVLDRRGDEPPDVATEHPARLEATLAKAREQGYAIVVLDTAPHADQGALLASRNADLVVVPVRPSILDIDAAQTTMDICALAGRKPRFVLNATAPQGRDADEARSVITQRGGMVVASCIGERKAFRSAFNEGRGAQEIDIKSKAAAEIMALYAELNISTLQRSDKRTRKPVGV